jgi:hypothetical protein
MNSPVALLSAFIFLSAVFVVHANQPFCEQAKELGANTCKLFGSDSKECHILQESQRAKCAGEAKSPQLESVDALLDVGVDTSPTPTAAGDATTAGATTAAAPTPTAATTTATTTSGGTTTGGTQDGSGASQDFVCEAWNGTELNDYSVWMTNTTQNNVCVVDSDGAAKNCKSEDDVNNLQDGKIVGFGFELTHAQALPTNVNCTGKKNHCMIYSKMGKNEAVQWTVAGSTANVKLTYLKYSVCKTVCKDKDGQCDCSTLKCAVRKVMYKCTCVSDASGACPANQPCPWDTRIEHEAFPLMYA